ncbi:hypothetical protein WDZ92_38235, partial [Nostoc sp. NIES-2111]
RAALNRGVPVRLGPSVTLAPSGLVGFGALIERGPLRLYGLPVLLPGAPRGRDRGWDVPPLRQHALISTKSIATEPDERKAVSDFGAARPTNPPRGQPVAQVKPLEHRDS